MRISIVQDFVRSVLDEARAESFDDWLSPDVMDVLVGAYADNSSILGKLNWSYAKLPEKRWGMYVPEDVTLYVNKSKTQGFFKKQVETVLHEIQHWNQHVKVAKKLERKIPDASSAAKFTADKFLTLYSDQGDYVGNVFEKDARQFATKNLEDAMQKIGQHYAGKLEGGDLETVIEELLNDYKDGGEEPLTRLQIGTALRAWNMNSQGAMKQAIETLLGMGIKIK